MSNITLENVLTAFAESFKAQSPFGLDYQANIDPYYWCVTYKGSAFARHPGVSTKESAQFLQGLCNSAFNAGKQEAFQQFAEEIVKATKSNKKGKIDLEKDDG